MAMVQLTYEQVKGCGIQVVQRTVRLQRCTTFLAIHLSASERDINVDRRELTSADSWNGLGLQDV